MTGRQKQQTTYWTRRKMLAAGFGTLAALLLPAPGCGRKENRRPADPMVEVLDNRDAAARVGERVLDQYPTWNDATKLRAELQKGLDENANIRKELAQKIRRDFETGEVVDVDGWLLGATEARLYALAALHH